MIPALVIIFGLGLLAGAAFLALRIGLPALARREILARLDAAGFTPDELELELTRSRLRLPRLTLTGHGGAWTLTDITIPEPLAIWRGLAPPAIVVARAEGHGHLPPASAASRDAPTPSIGLKRWSWTPPAGSGVPLTLTGADLNLQALESGALPDFRAAVDELDGLELEHRAGALTLRASAAALDLLAARLGRPLSAPWPADLLLHGDLLTELGPKPTEHLRFDGTLTTGPLTARVRLEGDRDALPSSLELHAETVDETELAPLIALVRRLPGVTIAEGAERLPARVRLELEADGRDPHHPAGRLTIRNAEDAAEVWTLSREPGARGAESTATATLDGAALLRVLELGDAVEAVAAEGLTLSLTVPADGAKIEGRLEARRLVLRSRIVIATGPERETAPSPAWTLSDGSVAFTVESGHTRWRELSVGFLGGRVTGEGEAESGGDKRWSAALHYDGLAIAEWPTRSDRPGVGDVLRGRAGGRLDLEGQGPDPESVSGTGLLQLDDASYPVIATLEPAASALGLPLPHVDGHGPGKARIAIERGGFRLEDIFARLVGVTIGGRWGFDHRGRLLGHFEVELAPSFLSRRVHLVLPALMAGPVRIRINSSGTLEKPRYKADLTSLEGFEPLRKKTRGLLSRWLGL